MKRSALALFALLALTGCDTQWSPSKGFHSPGLRPPPFEMGGRTYQWGLLGVRGRAGLMLTRLDHAGGGPVVFTLSCSDPGYGALTLRMGAPQAGALSMQAGEQAFTVEALRNEINGSVRVSGESYFPDGWVRAVGAADKVVVTNGSQRWTFDGPGRVLSRRFDQFCHGRR